MSKGRQYTFALRRDNKELGVLCWQNGSDHITGDAVAVAAFEKAIRDAIAVRHEGNYPMPLWVVIDRRPTSVVEMITVLEFGGFAIPDVFAGSTAQAQRAHMQDDESDGLFAGVASRVY